MLVGLAVAMLLPLSVSVWTMMCPFPRRRIQQSALAGHRREVLGSSMEMVSSHLALNDDKQQGIPTVGKSQHQRQKQRTMATIRSTIMADGRMLKPSLFNSSLWGTQQQQQQRGEEDGGSHEDRRARIERCAIEESWGTTDHFGIDDDNQATLDGYGGTTAKGDPISAILLLLHHCCCQLRMNNGGIWRIYCTSQVMLITAMVVVALKARLQVGRRRLYNSMIEVVKWHSFMMTLIAMIG